tara:strand:+ start:559 stop:735 length:177 start_codon:yes stop_codon:yes gene_type:complete
MKVGDLVVISEPGGIQKQGLVVGFNKKGEGGKDYVHVMVEGTINVFLSFNVEVINEIS